MEHGLRYGSTAQCACVAFVALDSLLEPFQRCFSLIELEVHIPYLTAYPVAVLIVLAGKGILIELLCLFGVAVLSVTAGYEYRQLGDIKAVFMGFFVAYHRIRAGFEDMIAASAVKLVYALLFGGHILFFIAEVGEYFKCIPKIAFMEEFKALFKYSRSVIYARKGAADEFVVKLVEYALF